MLTRLLKCSVLGMFRSNEGTYRERQYVGAECDGRAGVARVLTVAGRVAAHDSVMVRRPVSDKGYARRSGMCAHGQVVWSQPEGWFRSRASRPANAGLTPRGH